MNYLENEYSMCHFSFLLLTSPVRAARIQPNQVVQIPSHHPTAVELVLTELLQSGISNKQASTDVSQAKNQIIRLFKIQLYLVTESHYATTFC